VLAPTETLQHGDYFQTVLTDTGRSPSKKNGITTRRLSGRSRHNQNDGEIYLKVSDEFTVPLCRGHHRQLHQTGNELAWWVELKIEPLVLVRELQVQTHPTAATENRVDWYWRPHRQTRTDPLNTLML
jgi:hypothetical protein